MIDDRDGLSWLCDWYARQSNGEWEHEFGIAIDTLDNPGWSLRIDLTDTPLEGRTFQYELEDEGRGWIRLWTDLKSNVFHGAGSPSMLPAMLDQFRVWASAHDG